MNIAATVSKWNYFMCTFPPADKDISNIKAYSSQTTCCIFLSRNAIQRKVLHSSVGWHIPGLAGRNFTNLYVTYYTKEDSKGNDT